MPKGKGKKKSPWKISGAQPAMNRQVGVADKQFVRLRYFEYFDKSGVTLFDQVFNLNSLFDPDQSGGGHQPLEFSQWAAMYNRYLVRRCRYRVTFCQNSTTSITVVGVAPQNNSNTALSLTQQRAALESPYGKAHMFSLSPNQPGFVITGNIDLARLTGVTPTKYASDDVYQAVVGASPSEIMGLHIFAFDLAATNVNISFIVELEFDAALWDRANVASSLFGSSGFDQKSLEKYEQWKHSQVGGSLSGTHASQSDDDDFLASQQAVSSKTSSSSSSSRSLLKR